MRITDIVADWLIETDVMEQASARKDVRNEVRYLKPQIVAHLLKMFIHPDSRDVNHWKGEVDGWFKNINGLKLKGTKNGRLSRDVLFSILYDEPFGEGIDDLNRRFDSLPDMHRAVDDAQKTEMLKSIHAVMTAVCTDLSQGKFTTIDDYLNV